MKQGSEDLKRRILVRGAALGLEHVHDHRDNEDDEEDLEGVVDDEDREPTTEELGTDNQEVKTAVARQPKSTSSSKSEAGEPLSLPINRVLPWEKQPRRSFPKTMLKALGANINTFGQRTPITVTVHPEKPGYWLVVDGQCRLEASKLVGRRIILAHILPQMTEKERLVNSLIPNFARKGHTPYEYGLAIKRLRTEHNFSTNAIATMFGTSTCWVLQHESLAKLASEVVALIDESAPKERHLKYPIARLLTPLPYSLQIEIASAIAGRNMRLPEARHLVAIKAQEAGLQVGGVASRPDRRKMSLRTTLETFLSTLSTFTDSPPMPLKRVLEQFSPEELGKLDLAAKNCQKTIQVLREAIGAKK